MSEATPQTQDLDQLLRLELQARQELLQLIVPVVLAIIKLDEETGSRLHPLSYTALSQIEDLSLNPQDSRDTVMTKLDELKHAKILPVATIAATAIPEQAPRINSSMIKYSTYIGDRITAQAEINTSNQQQNERRSQELEQDRLQVQQFLTEIPNYNDKRAEILTEFARDQVREMVIERLENEKLLDYINPIVTNNSLSLEQGDPQELRDTIRQHLIEILKHKILKEEIPQNKIRELVQLHFDKNEGDRKVDDVLNDQVIDRIFNDVCTEQLLFINTQKTQNRGVDTDREQTLDLPRNLGLLRELNSYFAMPSTEQKIYRILKNYLMIDTVIDKVRYHSRQYIEQYFAEFFGLITTHLEQIFDLKLENIMQEVGFFNEFDSEFFRNYCTILKINYQDFKQISIINAFKPYLATIYKDKFLAELLNSPNDDVTLTALGSDSEIQFDKFYDPDFRNTIFSNTDFPETVETADLPTAFESVFIETERDLAQGITIDTAKIYNPTKNLEEMRSSFSEIIKKHFSSYYFELILDAHKVTTEAFQAKIKSAENVSDKIALELEFIRAKSYLLERIILVISSSEERLKVVNNYLSYYTSKINNRPMQDFNDL